jgi:hypothetical protein
VTWAQVTAVTVLCVPCSLERGLEV